MLQTDLIESTSGKTEKGFFEWNKTIQFRPFQIILAFVLPSSLAFVGFRAVLPAWVGNGYPKVLVWGIVASLMLLILVILGACLIYRESKKLNISFSQRLCLKKLTAKQWATSLGIMIGGLVLSMLAVPLVELLSQVPGFRIPDYMPFWLNPSVNPMQTDIEVLSPGYPLKGNYFLVAIMGITLLLNILAEEIYFRAWLLPKMQNLGFGSWVVNGILFALYHAFQLWLFPVLLVVSLSTALTVYISKSIWPAFAVHMVANFLISMLGILALVFG